MPKAEPNSGLLQEIVGQLRQLNKSSATDMLREAEALKRQEKLQATTQEQTDLSGIVVDDNKDFQRRFISAQASQIMNEERRLKPARKKSLEIAGGSRQALARDEVRQTNMYHLSQIAVSYARTSNDIIEDYAQVAENEFGYMVESLSNIEKWTSLTRLTLGHMSNDTKLMRNALHMLTAEIGPHSIEVHDASTQESISEVLTSDKKRNDELDRQRNTDLRAEEEARRERMRLLAKGAGGMGMGMGGSDGEGGEDGEGGGNFWNSIKALGGGYLLGKLGAMKKWFGMKKASLMRIMKGSFGVIGAKLFPNSKMAKFVGPIKPSTLANPRKWPYLLAALVAGTFLASGSDLLGDDEDGEELGNDVLPGDIDGLAEGGAFSKNVDLLFTAAMAGGFLSRFTLVRNVSTSVGNKVRTSFANAKPNSMRSRLYANAAFKRGLSLTGRSLLRFMGPWGFGLWIAWELGNIVMNQISDQEKEADEAIKIINSEQISAADSLLSDPAMATFFDKPGGPMQLNSGAKVIAAREKIRELMKGKSAEVQKRLKADLMVLGWGGFEIDTLINQANGTWDNTDFAKNLLVGQRPDGRTGLNGVPLQSTNIGTIDSSVNQVISYHYFLKGREVSTWTGKPGFAPIGR